MHPPIREGLEDYLAGKRPDPEFQRHLENCVECREQVELFESHALLVRELRVPDTFEFEPSPGFYARVMDRVEQQRNASIWSVFLEPLFARRLMYATAALTMLLGVFLFTSPKDDDFAVATTPHEMVGEDLPFSAELANVDNDRSIVFVQAVSYRGE